ncbi:D-alanyl-D-alanine carboxypeptidase, partial [Candidatus Berkelbacteria bacterium]|nr:D-alanyl-D-alanine carboxypeptidase [Candidatus Berkelbacteria bacterium]
EFVAEMNSYATKLGVKNTIYGDPAGLNDDVGRSTAFDLSIIARRLLQDEFLSEVVSTAKTTIFSVDKTVKHDLVNSNRLLQKETPYYLKNTLGIKTGYTLKAGYCLVAAYQFGDRELVGVILNTTEISTSASAKEMRKLFTWAEQNLEAVNY